MKYVPKIKGIFDCLLNLLEVSLMEINEIYSILKLKCLDSGCKMQELTLP